MTDRQTNTLNSHLTTSILRDGDNENDNAIDEDDVDDNVYNDQTLQILTNFRFLSSDAH